MLFKMPNPLKHLRKINKRDTLGDDSRISYVCKVNNGNLQEFPTKVDMMSYIEDYRRHFNEIESLSMYKIEIHSLIS